MFGVGREYLPLRIFMCNSTVHYCRHRNVVRSKGHLKEKGNCTYGYMKREEEKRRKRGRRREKDRREERRVPFLFSALLSPSPARIFLFCRVDLKNVLTYITISFPQLFIMKTSVCTYY